MFTLVVEQKCISRITRYYTGEFVGPKNLYSSKCTPPPPLLLLLLIPQFLIRWQLSIWICRKPFFSLLYNCQLLCFWRLALSIIVEVFPRPFFRLFTANSLCLFVCPIHEWRLFFKIFKSNIPSFAL